jgi:hypothetical protein
LQRSSRGPLPTGAYRLLEKVNGAQGRLPSLYASHCLASRFSVKLVGIPGRIPAPACCLHLPGQGTTEPRGTWHWLDIYSGETKAHIVRTEDPAAFPEDTPNRQDARATNMGDLFETDDDRIVRLSPPPRLYTWLCYRTAPNGDLSHALWQAPSADADEWLARINLKIAVVTKKIDENRPGRVDPKTKMKLREDVQQLVAKRSNNDSN